MNLWIFIYPIFFDLTGGGVASFHLVGADLIIYFTTKKLNNRFIFIFEFIAFIVTSGGYVNLIALCVMRLNERGIGEQ